VKRKSSVFQLPLNGGVAHGADAVRAGKQDRSFHETGFLDPVDAGHVAVAVLIERRREHRIPVAPGSRQNGGHAGANRAFAGNNLAVTRNKRYVPDRDAANVGDGVQFSRLARKRDSELAPARTRLRRAGERHYHRDQQNQGSSHDTPPQLAGRKSIPSDALPGSTAPALRTRGTHGVEVQSPPPCAPSTIFEGML
jgi:hypothetical protein